LSGQTVTWLAVSGVATGVGWLWVRAVVGDYLDTLNERPGTPPGYWLAGLLWLLVPGLLAAFTWSSDFTGLFISGYFAAAFVPLLVHACWGDNKVLGGWLAVSWYLICLPLGAWVIEAGADMETDAAFQIHANLVWLATVGGAVALTMPGWFVANAIGGVDGALIAEGLRLHLEKWLTGAD